ncbi:MAG: hypothetical protein LiPW30_754 [Parcubacteria group bacterium LiPW_30]|nr:MAG: hypothetical protein LiPW30_754 [Parcubacteria group bacterium LiPW_30]
MTTITLSLQCIPNWWLIHCISNGPLLTESLQYVKDLVKTVAEPLPELPWEKLELEINCRGLTQQKLIIEHIPWDQDPSKKDNSIYLPGPDSKEQQLFQKLLSTLNDDDIAKKGYIFLLLGFSREEYLTYMIEWELRLLCKIQEKVNDLQKWEEISEICTEWHNFIQKCGARPLEMPWSNHPCQNIPSCINNIQGDKWARHFQYFPLKLQPKTYNGFHSLGEIFYTWSPQLHFDNGEVVNGKVINYFVPLWIGWEYQEKTLLPTIGVVSQKNNIGVLAKRWGELYFEPLIQEKAELKQRWGSIVSNILEKGISPEEALCDNLLNFLQQGPEFRGNYPEFNTILEFLSLCLHKTQYYPLGQESDLLSISLPLNKTVADKLDNYNLSPQFHFIELSESHDLFGQLNDIDKKLQICQQKLIGQKPIPVRYEVGSTLLHMKCFQNWLQTQEVVNFLQRPTDKQPREVIKGFLNIFNDQVASLKWNEKGTTELQSILGITWHKPPETIEKVDPNYWETIYEVHETPSQEINIKRHAFTWIVASQKGNIVVIVSRERLKQILHPTLTTLSKLSSEEKTDDAISLNELCQNLPPGIGTIVKFLLARHYPSFSAPTGGITDLSQVGANLADSLSPNNVWERTQIIMEIFNDFQTSERETILHSFLCKVNTLSIPREDEKERCFYNFLKQQNIIVLREGENIPEEGFQLIDSNVILKIGFNSGCVRQKTHPFSGIRLSSGQKFVFKGTLVVGGKWICDLLQFLKTFHANILNNLSSWVIEQKIQRTVLSLCDWEYRDQILGMLIPIFKGFFVSLPIKQKKELSNDPRSGVSQIIASAQSFNAIEECMTFLSSIRQNEIKVNFVGKLSNNKWGNLKVDSSGYLFFGRSLEEPRVELLIGGSAPPFEKWLQRYSTDVELQPFIKQLQEQIYTFPGRYWKSKELDNQTIWQEIVVESLAALPLKLDSRILEFLASCKASLNLEILPNDNSVFALPSKQCKINRVTFGEPDGTILSFSRFVSNGTDVINIDIVRDIPHIDDLNPILKNIDKVLLDINFKNDYSQKLIQFLPGEPETFETICAFFKQNDSLLLPTLRDSKSLDIDTNQKELQSLSEAEVEFQQLTLQLGAITELQIMQYGMISCNKREVIPPKITVTLQNLIYNYLDFLQNKFWATVQKLLEEQQMWTDSSKKHINKALYEALAYFCNSSDFTSYFKEKFARSFRDFCFLLFLGQLPPNLDTILEQSAIPSVIYSVSNPNQKKKFIEDLCAQVSTLNSSSNSFCRVDLDSSEAKSVVFIKKCGVCLCPTMILWDNNTVKAKVTGYRA